MTNNWRDVLYHQLLRVYQSGLYDYINEYHLVVTDVNNEKDELDDLLVTYPKIILNYYPDNKLYETHAIQKVQQLGRDNENLNILYFHTKGVSNNGIKNYKTKEVSFLKQKSVENYKEILEYFLIDNWKDCIKKLNEGHHIVGVNCVWGMWWGNFWWTRSEYVKLNEEFTFNEGDSRWKCERWIHIGNQIHPTPEFKSHEFYHFWCDNYFTIIPKYLYDKTDKSSIRYNIHKAEYGYFADAQHEAQPLPLDEDIVFDITEQVKEYFEKSNSSKFDIYIEQKDLPIINYPNLDKRLRIHYSTNLDNTVYIVSSIPDTQPQFISKIQL
jgi:hypothetical protein